MDVFLAGATGYLGGSVAVRLLKAGHAVTGLVRDARKVDSVRGLGVLGPAGPEAWGPGLASYALGSDSRVRSTRTRS